MIRFECVHHRVAVGSVVLIRAVVVLFAVGMLNSSAIAQPAPKPGPRPGTVDPGERVEIKRRLKLDKKIRLAPAEISGRTMKRRAERSSRALADKAEPKPEIAGSLRSRRLATWFDLKARWQKQFIMTRRAGSSPRPSPEPGTAAPEPKPQTVLAHTEKEMRLHAIRMAKLQRILELLLKRKQDAKTQALIKQVREMMVRETLRHQKAMDGIISAQVGLPDVL